MYSRTDICIALYKYKLMTRNRDQGSDNADRVDQLEQTQETGSTWSDSTDGRRLDASELLVAAGLLWLPRVRWQKKRTDKDPPSRGRPPVAQRDSPVRRYMYLDIQVWAHASQPMTGQAS